MDTRYYEHGYYNVIEDPIKEVSILTVDVYYFFSLYCPHMALP